MPNGDKIQALYNAASKEYDLGSYNDFVQKLADPNKRQALYNAIGKEYDLGDYSTFNQKLGYDSKEVQSQNPQPTNDFANAQKPTGTISNQQVLQAQKHINTLPQQTSEQKNVAQYGENFVHAQQDEKVINAAKNTVKKKGNIGRFNNEQAQVDELVKGVDNGDLAVTQDASGNDVLKPTGNFIQNYKAAYTNAFQQRAEDAYLSSLPKDKAIEYLNQKAQHPELFTQEQNIAPSGLGKILGEQQAQLEKPIVGGIGGAALAPETGGASIGTFLAMSKDLASSGYSQALQKTYTRLKQLHPEMSDSEIYDKAHQAALTGEAVNLGTGTILSGKIPSVGKAATDGFLGALEHSVKTSPVVVGSAAVGSAINDLKENDVTGGQGVDWDEIKKNAEESAKSMAAMHFGFGALGAIVNGAKTVIPSYAKPQLENMMASADRSQVANVFQNAEDNGLFPQGTTQKALATLSAFDKQKAIVAPFRISEENKAAIAGKMVQKQKLLDELSALKPNENAFPERIAEIKKDITGIDGEINKLYNAKNVFEKETDSNTGEKNYQPKTFEELKPQEKQGIVVPKEYGDTEVEQKGEGENKTYTPKAYYTEQQGSLTIKKNIPVEGTFTDKDKAQEAADNALKQHYYENGLHDNAKPDKKIETEKESEKPNQETMVGSVANNELVSSNEKSQTEKNVGEVVQPQQMEIKDVSHIVKPIEENDLKKVGTEFYYKEDGIFKKGTIKSVVQEGNEYYASATDENGKSFPIGSLKEKSKQLLSDTTHVIEAYKNSFKDAQEYGSKNMSFDLVKHGLEVSGIKPDEKTLNELKSVYDNAKKSQKQTPIEEQQQAKTNISSPINTNQNETTNEQIPSNEEMGRQQTGQQNGQEIRREQPERQGNGQANGNQINEPIQEKVGGQNASTQSGEQQQESVQQSSKPEHARTQQAGSESKTTSTESSDSNIGSEGEQEEVTSIKNATTRLRREQYGLDQEIPAAKKEFGDVWEKAKQKIADGYNPQDLVDELANKPRPLTDEENAILLHYQNTKEINLIDLNNKINEAAESDNPQALQEAKVAKARVLDELQKIYDVDKAVGTENARGLASRQMMVDRRYSLANMMAEKRATANDGKPLTEEQQAEVEALHKKIHETQEAFDNYVKQAEAEIKDLQGKILGKGVKNKKSAAQKLRDLADKIEKNTSGQAYASVVPITPKMIASAMRLIADGLEKGEDILKLIKAAIEKVKGETPDVDEAKLEKAINNEVINSGIISTTEREKKQTKDYSSLLKNGKLDRKALELKAAADRAKNEFDISLKKNEQKKRTFGQKAQDVFVKWQRGFKLSNPLTMGKLVMAGLTRLTTTPLEDVVGGAYSMALPKLAKGAIGEGGGLNVKETATAYKDGILAGMKDAYDVMRKGSQGKSDIDVAFGKLGEMPPEAIDFFGQLHSATKAPIKRAAFERSLAKRLRRSIANGVDVSDPLVQTETLISAYKDANRAIFMQDNKVATGFQNLVKYFERKDHKQAKYLRGINL